MVSGNKSNVLSIECICWFLYRYIRHCKVVYFPNRFSKLIFMHYIILNVLNKNMRYVIEAQYDTQIYCFHMRIRRKIKDKCFARIDFKENY